MFLLVRKQAFAFQSSWLDIVASHSDLDVACFIIFIDSDWRRIAYCVGLDGLKRERYVPMDEMFYCPTLQKHIPRRILALFCVDCGKLWYDLWSVNSLGATISFWLFFFPSVTLPNKYMHKIDFYWTLNYNDEVKKKWLFRDNIFFLSNMTCSRLFANKCFPFTFMLADFQK